MAGKYEGTTLSELERLEAGVLPRFDTEIAFDIGNAARAAARNKYTQPVLIDITLANGQVVYHSPSRVGTVLDNDVWVQRKKKTTLRFGRSSFYMGRKLAAKGPGATPETAMFVDSKEYATHGGSVPIRVEGFDGLVGALTVSGLAQDEDHLFALEVLENARSKIGAP